MRDLKWNVAIVGATSAIASATAEILAVRHCNLLLVARDEHKLQKIAGDLRGLRRGSVSALVADVTDRSSYARIVEAARAQLGDLDVALVAHGFMPDDAGASLTDEQIVATIDVNLTSTICLLRHISTAFEAQRRGTIAALSSIAGERGKRRNMVYAAAKAGLTAYLAGLRNHLHPFGVRVLTIVPGNTDTPMARGRQMKGPVASPRAVARGIVRALEGRSDIAYVPAIWGYVAAIIRRVPEAIYKRVAW